MQIVVFHPVTSIASRTGARYGHPCNNMTSISQCNGTRRSEGLHFALIPTHIADLVSL